MSRERSKKESSVTSTTIKGLIRKFVDLQKIDSEIYSCQKDLEEKPAAVEESKQEFEKDKAHLKLLEDKLKGILVKRREIELEVKEKEGGIAKANGQLNQIKTNKEYSAKLSEIESIKADMSLLEEKILASYDETDLVNAEIEKEKKKVSEIEKIFLAKKKEVEDQVKALEDRLKVLEGQRKQLTPSIDPNALNRYEKVLRHKEGLAIAPVNGNVCGGCYMNITPQMANEIKMHGVLIECEKCSRILYFEDDL